MGVLDGRHALVTGAGSGIGTEIATALAADGAALTLAGRRAGPLDALAATLPRAGAITADVSDEVAVAGLVTAAEAARGPLDILVASAGIAPSARFASTSLAAWRETIDINLGGAFLCARAVVTGMCGRGWGRIVFVASTAGLKGYPYVAAYCAAKHGVVGLTRALALETAAHGVTVNALCPGFTDTPLLDAAIERIADRSGAAPAAARAALAAANPQGRLVRADEVADAARWLCGPAAGAVNGQAIPINGGEP